MTPLGGSDYERCGAVGMYDVRRLQQHNTRRMCSRVDVRNIRARGWGGADSDIGAAANGARAIYTGGWEGVVSPRRCAWAIE